MSDFARIYRQQLDESEARDSQALADFINQFVQDYDPNEPRDPAGKWTTGSSTSANYSKESGWTTNEGSPVPEHIQKLKIPPAWKNVHYNPDPNGNLLVVGRDAKGRQQSKYSEAHWAKSEQTKFNRIDKLDKKFEQVMKENDEKRKSSDPKVREVADALYLVAKTGIRPGSEKDTGAEKQAYGATTLEGRHVVQEGNNVSLKFTGKKGVDLNILVIDPEARRMVLDRKKLAGETGQLFNISAADLSSYIGSLDGGGFHTKDLRTLLGTRMAMEEVEKVAPPKSAIEYKKKVMAVAKIVSDKLGNTPAVALKSYISPSVFAKWRLA